MCYNYHVPVAKPFAVTDRRQIRALASPVRQEIVDALSASGPATVSQLASQVDLRPDRLYFHLSHLERVGLVKRSGSVPSGRRPAAVFTLAGSSLKVTAASPSRAHREAVADVVDGVLRLARRNARRALVDGGAVLQGRRRNTFGAGARGWLTAAETRQAAALTERLVELHRRGRRRPGTTLRSLVVFSIPLEERRTRRQESAR